MTPLLAIIAAAFTEKPPELTVGAIKRGESPAPTGRVRIHAIRSGVWVSTEPVDAAIVDWSRLLDEDRIEILD